MRKYRAVPAALLGGLFLLSTVPAQASAGLEDRVLAEMNRARMHPQEYARALRKDAYAGGIVGESEIGNEDVGALDEAIDFLMRQRPLPPLKADEALAAAARSHARAQGRTWQVGHISPDGATLSERLRTHGVFAGLSAENISYGYDDAREVVRQLIIDSRVPSRGHRQNIFGAHYQAAGVSCAPHREYGSMCVIDFAGAFVRR
jgi:hypothetical protein